MQQFYKKNVFKDEKGSAGMKLVIALVVIFLIGHAGYQYIPTAYQDQQFKSDMQTAVIQGITMPASRGNPVDITREKIKRLIQKNDVPFDTYYDVKMNKNVLTARVYYVKKVPLLPFGMYDYDYVFDRTFTPAGYTED